jgi:Flp pilus assembly protein TadD
MFSRPLFLQGRTAIFVVSAAGLVCAFAAGKGASENKKKQPAPATAAALTTPADADEDSASAQGGAKTKPAAPEPSPQFRRAVGAMRAGDWKAARTAWETVLRAEPANAAALANLGKVLCQLQDYPAAQTVLEKATALKPSLSDSWLMLGQTWLARQSPMMAVSCMARGVAENPSDAGGHNSLAIALKQAGWTDAAEAELQKALDLNPAFGEAHFNLAVMYLERKPPSLEMGRRHYRRALELGAMADPVVAKQIQGESVLTNPEPNPVTDGKPSTAPSASTPEADTGNPAGNRVETPGTAGSASPANSGDAAEKNASASGPGTIAPVPPAPAASPARKAGAVPARSPSTSSPTPSPASSSPRSPSRKS